MYHVMARDGQHFQLVTSVLGIYRTYREALAKRFELHDKKIRKIWGTTIFSDQEYKQWMRSQINTSVTINKPRS